MRPRTPRTPRGSDSRAEPRPGAGHGGADVEAGGTGEGSSEVGHSQGVQWLQHVLKQRAADLHASPARERVGQLQSFLASALTRLAERAVAEEWPAEARTLAERRVFEVAFSHAAQWSSAV